MSKLRKRELQVNPELHIAQAKHGLRMNLNPHVTNTEVIIQERA